MNVVVNSDMHAAGEALTPPAGWDAVFSAWTKGVDIRRLRWPHGGDPGEAEVRTPKRPGRAARLPIEELVRRAFLRRLLAVSHSQSGAEDWSVDDLEEALSRAETQERGGREQIEDTLALARSLNIDGLRQKLTACSKEFDIGDFILLYTLPLMRRVGDLWAASEFSVAAEHLVSSALLSALRSDSLNRHGLSAPRLKMLVATPYGELHEVGALAACRLAQSHGFDPLYVGAQLPVYEIARLARHNAIRIIVMGGSSASSDLPMQQLRQLAEIVEAGTIIFTGGSAYETVADQRDVAIRHCRSMRHFCCQMEIMAALAQSLIAVE